MSKLAEVVTLYDQNASDISAMLRKAADMIDNETDADARTEAIIGVQLHENGEIQIYGWGRVDSIKAIGMLQLGLHKMGLEHFAE